MSRNIQTAILVSLSSIFLSIPFLVPGTGFVSLFAFVPLLLAENIATSEGRRGFCWWHYLCFVLWNAATTFWVCNATVGGGLFAIFANAFQMSLVFGIFRWSRKHLQGALPYIFLAFLWIAWERYYLTRAQISWPWLVLGNSFARSTGWIQWYEYTGTLGGSLWIWASNLTLFGLLNAFLSGAWKTWNIKARIASLAGLAVLLVFIPLSSLLLKPEMDGDGLDVTVVQPNIDPYNKFGGMTQEEQNSLLLSQMNSSEVSAGTLFVAPETFTNDVVTDAVQASPTVSLFQGFVEAHPGTSFLFGASSRTFLQRRSRPSETARQLRDGRWMETHNSALMLNGGEDPQIFHKSKLVVGVESMPYPSLFRHLDEMLGGVMGRDVGQKEVSLLNCKGADGRSIPLGCAICYESVYGEYCTEYVRKGAEALAVITNDAWWKDTPGYRQHLSYSSLRAIETRRWVARCANTGISAVIDPSGKILAKTSWWKPEVLHSRIGLRTGETFFVSHGDFIGRISVLMALLILLGTLVRRFTSR